MMTQLLSLILGKIKQPKVIAEVIGGILLGMVVLLIFTFMHISSIWR